SSSSLIAFSLTISLLSLHDALPIYQHNKFVRYFGDIVLLALCRSALKKVNRLKRCQLAHIQRAAPDTYAVFIHQTKTEPNEMPSSGAIVPGNAERLLPPVRE